MKKNVRLSQCMIVKNEEKNIEKALSWGKGIVYEQIVVDTGSDDRTVEIAEHLGARVFHYQWQDDFSAAKNYALEQVSGDWVAFLDADEYFDGQDAKKLIPLLNRIETAPPGERIHAIKCTLLNIGDHGEVFASAMQTRLFKTGSAYYKNRIHEQLQPGNEWEFRCLNMADNLVIYHTGYAPKVYRNTDKLERNVRMIQKVLEAEPDNWDYWSYLGDTLFTMEDNPGAMEAYQKVISHRESRMDLSRLDTAFVNLVRILMRERDGDAEHEILDLYEEFQRSGSNCPDVYYWIGIYYMSKNKKDEGCRYLERALVNLEVYKRGASLIASERLGEIYGVLEHAYAELEDAPQAVKYGVLSLRLDRYQQPELNALITLMKSEPAGEVIGFLGKLYDLSQMKDKLFLMKAAKEAGAYGLEEALYRLLSSEEQRWLDRKGESPYTLSAAERSARYPSMDCRNASDTKFLELLEEIRREDHEYLLEQMKEKLNVFKKRQGNYKAFADCFSLYQCWGKLIPEMGEYEAFEKRIASLKDHWEAFLWLYGRLGDYRSRRVAVAVLDNWLHLDFQLLDQAKEGAPYFIDTDLIPSAEGMVYLDISTTDFQTVWDFIQTYGEVYQDIYCYAREIPEGSQFPRKISAYKHVTILEDMPQGSLAIPNAPLFLKLDVEEELLSVLDGFQAWIAHCRPILAMCVDDGYEAVWAAARKLQEMDPSYRFYLRYYGGNLIPTKYVLFAL